MHRLKVTWNVAYLQIILTVLAGIVQGSGLPKLLIISMDGFRYNYLDNIPAADTANFQYFIKNGVKARYMKPVLPSVTYPNHYSLITGLYPESHGMVHNRFYDPDLKEHFWYDTIRDNIDPLWYDVGAEPIYVTNNLAGEGRRSGSVLWPSGIGRVKCVGPDRVIPHYANAFTEMNFTERVDHIVDWFSDEKEPINLGLVYFPEPDEIAHKFGPGSDEVRNFIKGELNSVLGYLIEQLKAKNLLETMNIILTADHGFSEVKKTVYLDQYLDLDYINKTGSNFHNSVMVHIYPAEGRENDILNGLKRVPNIQTYRKNHRDLMDLHYNNNSRIAPIIVLAQEGTLIRKDNHTDYHPLKGAHGYNPETTPNMRAFFLAMGPAFKKDFVANPFNNLDVYELMCHILKLKPAPNNGTLEHVQDMLVDDSFVEITYTITGISFLLLVGVTVCVAGLYTICACHNARKHRLLLPKTRGGISPAAYKVAVRDGADIRFVCHMCEQLQWPDAPPVHESTATVKDHHGDQQMGITTEDPVEDTTTHPVDQDTSAFDDTSRQERSIHQEEGEQ